MQKTKTDQPSPAPPASVVDGYPQWRLWRSDGGRWWATRTPPFPPAAETAEVHRTVDADDPDALREVIEEMEHRAAQAGTAL